MDQDEYNKALTAHKADLRLINSALEKKDFLVGNNVTIADIVVFGSSYLQMSIALDPGFRKSIPHFDAWFMKMA